LGKLSTGDKVQIKWSAEKASVFPVPPGGLEEELRVE
jgi:hypothetical protein